MRTPRPGRMCIAQEHFRILPITSQRSVKSGTSPASQRRSKRRVGYESANRFPTVPGQWRRFPYVIEEIRRALRCRLDRGSHRPADCARRADRGRELILTPTVPQLLFPRLDFHTQAILLWTVLLLLLAARSSIKSRTTSGPSCRRADYLLVWLAGSIVLVTLGVSMLGTLAPDVFGPPSVPAPQSEARFEDSSIPNASSLSPSSPPVTSASASEVLSLLAI